MKFRIRLNSRAYTVDVDPQKPLLWVLREDIGLCGTKYSCGIGICGTCTVLLDGIAQRSCVVAVESVGHRKVTTIEGLNDHLGNVVKEAWIEEKVSQCGYCQPGQIMNAYHLLSANPEPTDADIDKNMTTLCRCGTYQRIRSAIKISADRLNSRKWR
ncbi:MAG TPA: (2Fe-2S)-binding protein [Thermodesulfobacteriota bacterium]|nr:(2Fe-2S)-binding protein [Thermodesulfobacteriota bacterium]